MKKNEYVFFEKFAELRFMTENDGIRCFSLENIFKY